MRYAVAICCALGALGLLAPVASAGTVCQTGSVANYEAADVGGFCSPGGDPSEVNAVRIERNGSGALVIRDPANTITDGDGAGGCSVTANVATCPGATGYGFSLGAGNDSVVIVDVPVAQLFSTDLGAGDDDFTGGALADAASGGPGKDEIDGATGDDTLSGGDDDDAIVGGANSDMVFGDGGNDSVDGGDGSDTVEGGAGTDAVRGGNGDDFLESTRQACADGAGTDSLDGGPGNDLLCGGPGTAPDNDAIAGGAGLDSLTYRGRTGAVGTSLDGAANDGGQDEGDNVSGDVESLQGGSAGDNLLGGEGTQLIDGGPGGDVLGGLGGDDVLTDTGDDGGGDLLEGGSGDDVMAAGGGADVYNGGDGTDSVTDYGGRIGGVFVTLDDAADDGELGEGDNVRADVEDVLGGAGADTLRGSGADNELAGGGGADTIEGGGGNDGLHGGAGGDTLTGNEGSDLLDGGGGNDVIKVRDGLPDRAVCGGGTDRAEVDTRDDAFGDCETIDVSRPAPAVIRSAVASRTGVVTIDVACPATERACAGGVTVKTVRRISGKVRSLGVKSYRILGGQNELVQTTIPKSNRPALKRARRVKVRVIVTNYNSATGERSTAARTFTVRTSGLTA